MPKQDVTAEDQPVGPMRDTLPEGALMPTPSGLHFASFGFQEGPAPIEFGAMPEIMPPPPARPVLPPELRPDPQKPGLMSRLLGGTSS